MTDDPFVAHRSLLFTVAYEMLGSAADAEDVVQETWLRWAGVDQRPRCATRAPTWSGSSPGRRSTGCARWRGGARSTSASGCPSRCSPAPTSPRTSSSPRASRSRCSPCWRRSRPAERAVFVLREVFDVPYDEIAAGGRQDAGRGAADRPPGPRARGRAAAADRRSTAPSSSRWSSGSSPRCSTGDLQGLIDVLAPDVVLVADGGGVRGRGPAAGRGQRAGGDAPVPLPDDRAGARSIATLLAQRRARRPDRPRPASSTRRSACVVEDGRITRIYAIRNPHKLARLNEEATLSR